MLPRMLVLHIISRRRRQSIASPWQCHLYSAPRFYLHTTVPFSIHGKHSVASCHHRRIASVCHRTYHQFKLILRSSEPLFQCAVAVCGRKRRPGKGGWIIMDRYRETILRYNSMKFCADDDDDVHATLYLQPFLVGGSICAERTLCMHTTHDTTRLVHKYWSAWAIFRQW